MWVSSGSDCLLCAHGLSAGTSRNVRRALMDHLWNPDQTTLSARWDGLSISDGLTVRRGVHKNTPLRTGERMLDRLSVEV